MGPVCMSLSPGDSGGWFGSAPCVLPSLGRSRCPQGGISAPPASLPSPQCGEGTPQVTGFFEVFVAGKLVHSKKGGDGYVDTESKFLKLVAAIKAALAQA
uniref:Selenoprotein W n=1 Tax=Bos mutus grunniens TaxID=30521 RepID=A0A8B9YT73_BOSMU